MLKNIMIHVVIHLFWHRRYGKICMQNKGKTYIGINLFKDVTYISTTRFQEILASIHICPTPSSTSNGETSICTRLIWQIWKCYNTLMHNGLSSFIFSRLPPRTKGDQDLEDWTLYASNQCSLKLHVQHSIIICMKPLK